MEKKQMTPAMRAALVLKIQKNAAQNPEYKKHVEKKIQEFKDKQNKSNKFKIMKKNEVVVLSIVVGVIFASLFGYFFGENIFTSVVTGERVGPNTTSVEIKESILPNYQIGAISFMISAGIAYLISNRFVKND